MRSKCRRTSFLGPDAARKFWREYLERYITSDDIELLKRVGFNSIRISIHYKYFESDNADGFGFRPRAVHFLVRPEGPVDMIFVEQLTILRDPLVGVLARFAHPDWHAMGFRENPRTAGFPFARAPSSTRPAYWDEIVAYAKLPGTMDDTEQHIAKRPPQEHINRAFAELLDNIQSVSAP